MILCCRLTKAGMAKKDNSAFCLKSEFPFDAGEFISDTRFSDMEMKNGWRACYPAAQENFGGLADCA